MARLPVLCVVGCLLLPLVLGGLQQERSSERREVKRGVFSKIKCSLFGSSCPEEQEEQQEEQEENYQYGLLLDAGSSSTKLKVYRVTPASSPTSLPQIDIIYSQRFSPGLDSYGADVLGLLTYLNEIIEAAKGEVPESKQSSTPIYLMATAGLRFLSAEDATTLIDNTKSILSNPANSPFVYKPEGIGILSGEEEGVYAWIAANYLLGFFDDNKPTEEAVGVLEMGGGSTQITFVPTSPLYEGEFQVRVLGRNYELYVHSYLQFGINAIGLWVAQVLADRFPRRQKPIKNPCMLKGDSSEVTVDDNRTLRMVGSSEPQSCLEILTEILSPATGIRCEPKPCAIGNVYQPSVDDIRFYATQGFTYAPSSLHVISEENKLLNLQRLTQAAVEHCERSLTEATQAGIKKELASTTCLMGLYIPTLFTLSYGFPEDTTNIQATSFVGNETIDWSLGAMVVELAGNSVTRRRR